MLEINTDVLTKQFLGRFFENAPQSVAIFDTDMRYLAANPKWLESYGLEETNIIGKSHYEIFPEIGDGWKDIHQRCLKGDVDINEQAPFPRADGSLDWIRWEVRPWHTETEEIGGIIMYTEIITERVKVQQKFEENQTLLDKAQSIARFGHWTWNILTNDLAWSDEIYRIFGLQPQEFAANYEAFVNTIHPNDREAVQTAVNKALEGETYNIEHRIVLPDGTIRYVHEQGEVTFNDDGKPTYMIGTVQDITDRITTQQELEEKQKLLDKAQSIAHLGHWTWNILTNDLAWSDEIYRIFGLQPQEFAANYDAFTNTIHPNDRNAVQTAVNEALEGKPYSIGHRIVLPDGKVRHVHEQGEVTFEDGKPTYMIGTVQDITDRVEIQQKLEETVRELNESLLFKDQFLATMSHELRTPMNAVMGYSSLALTNPNLDPKYKNLFERIKVNSDRLINLINDILDISRINAGRTEIVHEPINLRELADGWHADFTQLVGNKGLEFDYQFDDNLPVEIISDEERLTQITNNLVSNAIKFTDDGQISLHILCQENGTGQNNLLIKVQDTGIGISDTWHHLIFEEFRQVQMGADRHYGGAGLGLSIVQKLCILMGGKVTLDSVPNEGSTFTVTIPIQTTSVEIMQ